MYIIISDHTSQQRKIPNCAKVNIEQEHAHIFSCILIAHKYMHSYTCTAYKDALDLPCPDS